MKRIIAVLSVVALLFVPVMAVAAPGNSGNGGNNGNHTGMGGGGSNGQGGGDGGQGGHGHGGNGGHGGGNHGGGHGGNGGSSPSVSAPGESAGAPSMSGGLGSFTYTQVEGLQGEGTIDALRACTSAGVPGRGLVDYKVQANGRFTYGGYEFAVPDFVQCMKDKGFKLDTAGRRELTDLGGHYGLPGHEAPQSN